LRKPFTPSALLEQRGEVFPFEAALPILPTGGVGARYQISRPIRRIPTVSQPNSPTEMIRSILMCAPMRSVVLSAVRS
jgi:hypothetical protein